ELGLAPAADTRELLRQASLGDAAAGVARWGTFRCAYIFPEPIELVGRETELARLMRVVERGRSTGQTVLIAAPARPGENAPPRRRALVKAPWVAPSCARRAHLASCAWRVGRTTSAAQCRCWPFRRR